MEMVLIYPKLIYNFCLFHAYMGDIAMCFATLAYLFQHIWSNLLTQYPSANFCLLLSVHCRLIPIFKVLGKFHKYIYKSALQKTPEARRGPEGVHPLPGGLLAWPEGRP